MVNRIGTFHPYKLNKRSSSSFYQGSQVWHETPEEDRKLYRSKCCEYNNKDEVSSPNIPNDEN